MPENSIEYEKLHNSRVVNATQEGCPPGRARITVPNWMARGRQLHGMPAEHADRSVQCKLVVDVPLDKMNRVTWGLGTPSFLVESEGEEHEWRYNSDGIGVERFMLTTGPMINSMVGSAGGFLEGAANRVEILTRGMVDPIRAALSPRVIELLEEAADTYIEEDTGEIAGDAELSVFIFNCMMIYHGRKERRETRTEA